MTFEVCWEASVKPVGRDRGTEVWKTGRFPSSRKSSWLRVNETGIRKGLEMLEVRRVRGGTRMRPVRTRHVRLQSVGNWALLLIPW